MVMYKYLIVLAALFAVSGCNSSRDAEAKAYSAGCASGIKEVIEMFGMGAKEDVIKDHCDKEGQKYIGNGPKEEKK
jgi:hypothetical protein